MLAFEPDPETFSLLRKNVERCALLGIELRNLALAGAAGTREMSWDAGRPGCTAASLFQGPGLHERRSVQCALLSEFIRERIDFLKLDIEGAELEVIDDLARTGKLQQVQQIVVEYHPALFPDRDGYSWLCKTLEKNGFQVGIRSGAPSPPGSSTAPPVTLFASRCGAAASS